LLYLYLNYFGNYNKWNNFFFFQRTYFLDAGAISAICFTVFGVCCTVGTIGIVLYRRRYLNKPQALSEPDSSVYIDDSTMRVSVRIRSPMALGTWVSYALNSSPSWFCRTTRMRCTAWTTTRFSTRWRRWQYKTTGRIRSNIQSFNFRPLPLEVPPPRNVYSFLVPFSFRFRFVLSMESHSWFTTRHHNH